MSNEGDSDESYHKNAEAVYEENPWKHEPTDQPTSSAHDHEHRKSNFMKYREREAPEIIALPPAQESDTSEVFKQFQRDAGVRIA